MKEAVFLNDSTIRNFPKAELFNSYIKANLYLPDSQNGYYKATRFDWSGIIYALEYNNHQYFSEWFEKYDPYTHDAICGPVDEFTQIGYEESLVGGEFLKIGIGTLRKPKEDNYNRFKLYEILNAGTRTIQVQSDSIVFQHILNSDSCSYLYTKEVILSDKELLLKYTLENTANKTLSTSVYNHNFFTIDKQNTGPSIAIRFSFNPEGEWRDKNCPAIINNNQINFSRKLNKGETVFMDPLTGFDPEKEGYHFTIENNKTRAGVKMTANHKLLKMIFWACPTTSCPEPYLKLVIHPGEKVKWMNKYEFYEF
ncbi:MAG: hypothetical protein ACOX19_06775 [Fermentimonas sp.]